MNFQVNNSIDYFRKLPQGVREIKNLNLSSIRKVFSLMGKVEKFVFLFLVAMALVSAWLSANAVYKNNTKPAPAFGGTYREGVVGQPRLLNPLLATSSTDNSLVHLIYSGLYTYDSEGKLVPDLAESMPTVSEDQKEYLVKIKSVAKFHNDRPVSADDVVYTIQTIQNPAFKSPLRNEWQNTTVEKVSDLEVRFKNSSVSAPFINNLTIPILPEKIWGRIDADTFQLSELNLKPIGSGPYQIREINKLPSGDVQKITLESNKNYVGGRPFIDRIVISFYESLEEVARAYKSGEISGFAYAPFTQVLNTEEQVALGSQGNIPLSQYQALFFNTNSKLLSDKGLRKALSFAIPKQTIIDNVFNGDARLLNSPILPEQLGYKEIADPGYAIETANAQLDSLGWIVNDKGERSKKNQTLEVTLVTNDSPVNVKTVEIIAAQWRLAHVKVNTVSLPIRELTDKNIRPRAFDALVFGQKMSADPDPFAFWHSSQAKDPGLNVSGFSNGDADGLITEARSTVIQDVRQDRYERFLEIVDEERPAVFLNQGVLVYPTTPDIKRPTISGIYDSSLRFNQVNKWYIKEKRVLK